MSATGSPSSYQDTWFIKRGGWLDKRGTLVTNQSDQTAQVVYGSTGWQSENVRATMLWSSGAGATMLRYNQSAMYYAFTVYSQSATLKLELVSSNLNRAQLAIWSSMQAISQTQDFETTFDCQGSNLRAWINGIKVFDITDSTLSAGQVGFDWQAGVGQVRDVHINVNQPDGSQAPVTLPTDFGAYCSVDDVNSLLTGIPTADIATNDDIYSYIKEASDMINRRTYTSFGRGTRVTERYDGTGQFTLVLTHSPILKIHLLKIFNFNNVATRTFSPGKEQGTTDDTEDTNALLVEKNYGLISIPPTGTPPTGLPLIPTTLSLYPSVNPISPSVTAGVEYDFVNRFGRGVRNIFIDYEYGFEIVPQRIRWACAKAVASLLLMKRGNKDTGGAVQLTMEGLTVSFAHRQGLSSPYGSIIQQWLTDIQDAIKDFRRMPTPIM